MLKRGLALKLLVIILVFGLVAAPVNRASASVSSATQEVNAVMEQLAPLIEEFEKNVALRDEISERPEVIALMEEFGALFLQVMSILEELDTVTNKIHYIEEFPDEDLKQLMAKKVELENELAVIETRGEEIEPVTQAISDELKPVEETLERLQKDLYKAGNPIREKYATLHKQVKILTKALEKNKKSLTGLTKQKKSITATLKKEKNSKNKQVLLTQSKKLDTDIAELNKTIASSTKQVKALKQELQVYLDGLITLRDLSQSFEEE